MQSKICSTDVNGNSILDGALGTGINVITSAAFSRLSIVIEFFLCMNHPGYIYYAICFVIYYFVELIFVTAMLGIGGENHFAVSDFEHLYSALFDFSDCDL